MNGTFYLHQILGFYNQDNIVYCTKPTQQQLWKLREPDIKNTADRCCEAIMKKQIQLNALQSEINQLKQDVNRQFEQGCQRAFIVNAHKAFEYAESHNGMIRRCDVPVILGAKHQLEFTRLLKTSIAPVITSKLDHVKGNVVWGSLKYSEKKNCTYFEYLIQISKVPNILVHWIAQNRVLAYKIHDEIEFSIANPTVVTYTPNNTIHGYWINVAGNNFVYHKPQKVDDTSLVGYHRL